MECILSENKLYFTYLTLYFILPYLISGYLLDRLYVYDAQVHLEILSTIFFGLSLHCPYPTPLIVVPSTETITIVLGNRAPATGPVTISF